MHIAVLLNRDSWLHLIDYKLIITIPMLNLLFMHYFFYSNDYIEWTWMYSEIANLCCVLFDISIFLTISLLIVRYRFKPAVAITQIITLIWSFINVMYGRFFFQYMSLSAIGEAHGLGDDLVINSMLAAFHWYDLFYIISIVCFILLYKKTKPHRIQKRNILKLLFISILSIAITLSAYSVYHFVHPHYRDNWDLYKFRFKEFLFDPVRGGTPNLAHFQIGCIRVAFYELYDMLHNTTLTEEQRKNIEKFYLDHSQRSVHIQRNPNIKNVIFILLESFLSSPIDLEVDGKEITPFLNSLKRDSNVYYNGKMISDIGCGESGDGQFIYMTGILPLRYKMTVGQVNKNILPALPKVFKEKLGIDYSEILVPTMPNLWQQANMNVAYGLTNAYWSDDIVGEQSNPIDDEMIFRFASNNIKKIKEPFFSLILSISTHSPYDKHVGPDYLADNKTLTKEYRNYLNSCHFLDKQLCVYFCALKKAGLYDRSMILIGSDHYAHLDMLKMSGKISAHTPLFIINGDIPKEKVWEGEFHQLDVYTTLLDVLNINQKWRGLGHTIISPSYNTSVNETVYNISEMIVNGNYFANY